MRILIFGSPKTQEVEWILAEAKKAGHDPAAVSLYDLNVGVKDGNPLFAHSEVDLLTYDVYLFRGITVHLWEGLLLAEWLLKKGKTIVDERLGTERYMPTKLSTAVKLATAGVPYPNTISPGGINAAKKFFKEATYPIVIKHAWGSKGQDMTLAKNAKEATAWAKNAKKLEIPILIQEYIPVRSDTRVLIVGDKVLGGMKRTAPKDDFRANIAVGGTAEPVELTQEMKDIALKAAKTMKVEISGVDLLSHDGTHYVLEVNRCPQFKGFQKSTGVNVAKEIVDYLLAKAE